MSHAALGALGIDAGSTTMKIVGVSNEGALAWHHIEAAHPRVEDQAENNVALVATGYGRKLVSSASRCVTEITCHARGVHQQLGRGGTLIDIGGQDSKVIVIADNGQVESFAMNDKCAAGTGRFFEVSAARLHITLDDFARIALAATGESAISSTCTVFAESEIISLIAHGAAVDHIVRGLHRSLIKRIVALARSAHAVPPLMLSGGVANSPAVRHFIAESMGHPVQVPPHPQLMGAYGAALIALAAVQQAA
jgi:predicted CoA-substrate-specific enzyme activase